MNFCGIFAFTQFYDVASSTSKLFKHEVTVHFLRFSLSLFPGGQLTLSSGVCLVAPEKNYFLCSAMTKQKNF